MSQTQLISNLTCPEKYVGYADLPNQIYRYCSIGGFDFNLMVVGESGLGKSTFINTLFASDIYIDAKYSEKNPPICSQTVEIRECCTVICENGVSLRLNLIDTPGYGDCINNSESWSKILSYINKRYEEYFTWENSSKRSLINDKRVHCCIYFISPSGHKLKNLDIDLLKKLQDKVNIIPVIGKSDTLTPDDLIHFKQRLLNDFKDNNINVYTFPDIIFKDMSDKDTIQSYIKCMPFSIVSSNFCMELNGKIIKCRKYPWGICEVENTNHCDFIPLRNLLLRTFTAHLIEYTHTNLYEKFRLLSLGNTNFTDLENSSPLQMIEMEKINQQNKLEQIKQELQDKYFAIQSEYRVKLEEKEKLHQSKVAELENEFAKLTNSDTSSLNDSSKASIDEKKKDKKKK